MLSLFVSSKVVLCHILWMYYVVSLCVVLWFLLVFTSCYVVLCNDALCVFLFYILIALELWYTFIGMPHTLSRCIILCWSDMLWFVQFWYLLFFCIICTFYFLLLCFTLCCIIFLFADLIFLVWFVFVIIYAFVD